MVKKISKIREIASMDEIVADERGYHCDFHHSSESDPNSFYQFRDELVQKIEKYDPDGSKSRALMKELNL